jgi:hypothetical protein
MLSQIQASDADVVSDDVPRDLTGTVCDLELLSGGLETGRGVWTKKDVITLGGGKRQNGSRSEKPKKKLCVHNRHRPTIDIPPRRSRSRQSHCP